LIHLQFTEDLTFIKQKIGSFQLRSNHSTGFAAFAIEKKNPGSVLLARLMEGLPAYGGVSHRVNPNKKTRATSYLPAYGGLSHRVAPAVPSALRGLTTV